MDTDIGLKNLDVFLHNKGFFGFEDYDRVPTGIMASEKNNNFIGNQLKYYNNNILL